ncbi:MAG: sugar transferase [Nocardioides sp.]|nr:sugar transferase [Nocardioides sp.]
MSSALETRPLAVDAAAVNDGVATLTSRLLAFVLILLLLPLMVMIAAAVVLTSRGPAWFRQERVGRSGTSFVIYKFRTMHAGADRRLGELLAEHGLDEVTPFFKVHADPRVTRLGSFLRKSSLDELPQLFNVLLGDMNLVGPRPQTPAEVATYDDHAYGRLMVRPGMTGLWQVSGRSHLGVQESLELDLAYVRDRSPWLDLKILARTPLAVVGKRGAV